MESRFSILRPVSSMALVCVVIPWVHGAAMGAESVQVEVRLRSVPLVAEEKIEGVIVIHNRSKRALRLIQDPSEAIGTQLVLSLGGQGPAGTEQQSRKETDWQRVTEGRYGKTVDLHPGEVFTWDLSCVLFGIIGFPIRRATFPSVLTVSVLVGQGNWVQTSVPFGFTDTKVAEHRLLLSRTRQSRVLVDGKSLALPVRIYQVQIGEEQFLFKGQRSRICRVPKGHAPDLFYEEARDVLRVRFHGLPNEEVRYDVPSGRVLSGGEKTTPFWWTRKQLGGPAPLSPEGLPHPPRSARRKSLPFVTLLALVPSCAFRFELA